MISEDLFTQVLINPIEKLNVNRLAIVSGYATSAMSFHHLDGLSKLGLDSIKVDLVIGMTSKDGITVSNHMGFKKLVSADFLNRFKCRYIADSPPVHSKLYIWFQNNQPLIAFAGSANYTQTAFCLKSQREIMTQCDPHSAADYFEQIQADTINCDHNEVDTCIPIYRDSFVRREYQTGLAEEAEFNEGKYSDFPSVSVSLLDDNGNLPERSGLNWGQRPEVKREPNQAYIRLTSKIYKSDFFPPRAVHFTLLTDDGKVLICSRAQENGKAIHTPHNNSLIGEYFRRRLGLANGAPVELHHLQKHGRTDLTFYKIDDETFYMSFEA